MTKRTTARFFVYGFAVYGVLWTIVESFGAFFEDQRPQGALSYSVIVAASVLIGLWKCRSKNSVIVRVPASDSSLEIMFGDLFTGSDPIVIPVNEFFDGSLGDRVSEQSLHGKFIRDYLGGAASTFNDLTSRDLASVSSETVQRSNGRKARYPIGTVATIDVNGQRFMLAALSKTDISTLKASATVHELWDCLKGVWEAVRNRSNGKCVSMPLIGSGLSGVGLPADNLIQIVVISFTYHTKQLKIADRVRLVLPTSMRPEVTLESYEGV